MQCHTRTLDGEEEVGEEVEEEGRMGNVHYCASVLRSSSREQISLMDIDPKLSRPLLRVATITCLTHTSLNAIESTVDTPRSICIVVRTSTLKSRKMAIVL